MSAVVRRASFSETRPAVTRPRLFRFRFSGYSPVRMVDVGLGHHRLQPGHQVGALGGQIMRLAQILIEIVELGRAREHRTPDGLPVLVAHRLLAAALVGLPVRYS